MITPNESAASKGSAEPDTTKTEAASVVAVAAEAPLTGLVDRPKLERKAAKVLDFNARPFAQKKLCDGMTMNLGDACVYRCVYCYAKQLAVRFASGTLNAENDRRKAFDETAPKLKMADVEIGRANAIGLLRKQLLDSDNKPRFFDDPKKVIYSPTLVDPAANMDLLKETAAACNLIFTHTKNWEVRLLSKSSLLHLLVKDKMIDPKHHRRLIFGFSTGTLDDKVADAIEPGTALVKKRLESLRWLQKHKFRTFGMICPSLPQENYQTFSDAICEAIHVDECEHVWAEVLNRKSTPLDDVIAALEKKKFTDEVKLIRVANESDRSWNDYARATFEAHRKNIKDDHFTFLHYMADDTEDYWKGKKKEGAVLLGSVAEELGLIGKAPTKLTPEQLEKKKELEERVSAFFTSSIDAANALREIFEFDKCANYQIIDTP